MAGQYLTFFPREVGFPTTSTSWTRKLLMNQKQEANIRKRYSGNRDVYYGAYPLEYLDRLFFDIDKNPLEQVQNFHAFLSKNDVKHAIVFSGRNFHIVVRTKPTQKNKDTLIDAQEKLLLKTGLEPDFHCLGNLAQLQRMLNTINLKSSKFCIPIAEDWLLQGMDKIRAMSNSPCSKEFWYGKKVLKLENGHKFEQREKVDFNRLSELLSPKTLPPCLKKVVFSSDPSHLSRYALCCYLLELISLGGKRKKEHIKEVINWMRENCTWEDFSLKKTAVQVEQIAHRGYRLKNCDWMKKRRLCYNLEAERCLNG